jgi:hypothetical protein
MEARDGHGTTIVFGTTGFAAHLLGVDGPNVDRGDIETTHMGTDTAKTFIPQALYDPGEVTLEIEHEADLNPPIEADSETITIDWGGLGSTWSFTGYMKSYKPSAKIGEKMTASITLKASGVVTGI